MKFGMIFRRWAFKRRCIQEAGLAIGEHDGIRVDEHMCTSDPGFFEVGDAVDVKCRIAKPFCYFELYQFFYTGRISSTLVPVAFPFSSFRSMTSTRAPVELSLFIIATR
jgi:hypothetical protein